VTPGEAILSLYERSFVKLNSGVGKLSAAFFLVQLLLTIGFILVSQYQNRQMASELIRERLRDCAYGLRPSVAESMVQQDGAKLESIIREFAQTTNVRVTVIEPDGKVQVDSERNAEELDNHRNRAEIVRAKANGFGEATRQSDSVDMEMHYAALPISVGDKDLGFLRVSTDTNPLQRRLRGITQSLVWFMIATVGLATGLLFVFARVLTAPLTELMTFAESVAQGDYRRRLSQVPRRGEWATLGKAFDRMQIELERRERELSENNDRLTAVLASMNEGVLAIDEQRRIQLANRASASLFDVSNQSLLQRPFYEIVRNPLVEKCVDDVFATHHTITREFETKRNPRRVLAMRIAWIAQHAGEAVVVVVHDVTNLRQLETMRRDFVANVSHELKTPLSSIRAYTETLRLGALEDEAIRMRFVERIEEQATRLNNLIMDLIELARIESGQTVFELSDVDICETSKRRVQPFLEQASKRNLSLTIEGAEKKILVRGDEEGIATILDNLVSNAVRYTPEGGKVIVRCSSDDGMGIIQVIDNGLGIAPEHQERVFERFYRVDKARSSDLGGTGLGLSIVKHIAQSLSGSVSLTSRIGKGCTFTVRIPLA
jgi:two-component system, OmpR family, phosphate regulon sensor histidine kinase PhoR